MNWRRGFFANNACSKDKSVVVEVLGHVVDTVCEECTTPEVEYFVDRFNIIDQTSYRNSQSTKDEEDSMERPFNNQSDYSSDDDFEKILESTRRQSLSQQRQDDDDDLEEIRSSNKTDANLIEHEYDILPAIEELRIHVENDILLEQFGKIVNIVDRLVVIEADSDVALDFDTVVFDSERNAVGQIFDVFGPVAKPMYAILFNDIEEANKWVVGSAMYYAPTVEQFTHKVFTEQLKQQKLADGCWDGQGDCPDDMLVFSDDETEQRYKAKRRSRKGTQRANVFPDIKKPRCSSIFDRPDCLNRIGRNTSGQFQNGSGRNYYGNVVNQRRNCVQSIPYGLPDDRLYLQ